MGRYSYRVQADLQLSVSRTGNCYDNAVAESFFAPVKLKLVQDRVFASHTEAYQALFDFIEIFYNWQRIQDLILRLSSTVPPK